jgi:TPR repeat protein
VLNQDAAGVKKDLKQAFAWYFKSATAGNASGMFKLAEMYEKGMGVNKDLTQALKWYKSAASRFLK